MKKIAILTSILALAACGGGNHSNNPGDIPAINSGIQVTEEARASNKQITSMESEILVPNNGTASANPSRASSVVRDNIKYTAYHLDDVQFNIAGSGTDNVNEDYSLNFGIDEQNGKINKVVINYSAEDGTQNRIEAKREDITQDNNKVAVFYNDVYKYKIYTSGKDGNNGTEYSYAYETDSLDYKIENRTKLREILEKELEGSGDMQAKILAAFDNGEGEWIEETHKHQFNLHGKYVANNLKYMDFGYDILTTVDDDESEADYTVILGGYDVKKIDPSKFQDKTLTFKGTAIGAAAYSTDSDYYSKPIETKTNDATLTFDKGKETLVMPFQDYYTVTVEKQGNNATVSFTDYPDSVDTGYKFSKEKYDTTIASDKVNVVTKYYGDNGNPSEVGALIGHEEWQDSNSRINFDAAFGGALKK